MVFRVSHTAASGEDLGGRFLVYVEATAQRLEADILQRGRSKGRGAYEIDYMTQSMAVFSSEVRSVVKHFEQRRKLVETELHYLWWHIYAYTQVNIQAY